MAKTKNINTHLTAKERDKLSFPANWLIRNGYVSGKILDFGCGNGADVKFIAKKGFEIIGYDKYYKPEYPTEKYDTILCQYVLNVLEKEEQAQVLMEVSELLKPEGRAYFTVRRDVKYQGFRTHKIHQKQTYQTNVVLPYKSVLKNDFTEIYEYQHYTTLNKGKTDVSPFFTEKFTHEIITESATAFAMYDKFPVNEGHALIIPKRKTANFFDLTEKEQTACLMVLNRTKKIITEKYNPNGFNVGINISEHAGQTIPHVHVHLIPRYKGDVKEPRGGVRGVVPEKRGY